MRTFNPQIISGFLYVFLWSVSAPMAAASDESTTSDIWLDVDTSAGLIFRDVDDALALIQAFHSPELAIRGVSAVYGNAPLDKAVAITREVVDQFGPVGLTVTEGSSSAEELGESNAAVEAMARALEEKPMSILALGPLTNVGSLVQLHPELHDRIVQIVAVAGRRPGQLFLVGDKEHRPFPDANFEKDSAAMAAILDTEIELVLAPWEVSSHVWITSDDLALLAEGGSSGAWIAEKSKSWITYWKQSIGTDGFNPFDTLAVGWVTHPEMIESFEGAAWIHSVEESYEEKTPGGEIVIQAKTKRLLLVEETAGKVHRVRYCYRPQPEWKSILLDRLKGDPKSAGSEK